MSLTSHNKVRFNPPKFSSYNHHFWMSNCRNLLFIVDLSPSHLYHKYLAFSLPVIVPSLNYYSIIRLFGHTALRSSQKVHTFVMEKMVAHSKNYKSANLDVWKMDSSLIIKISYTGPLCIGNFLRLCIAFRSNDLKYVSRLAFANIKTLQILILYFQCNVKEFKIFHL